MLKLLVRIKNLFENQTLDNEQLEIGIRLSLDAGEQMELISKLLAKMYEARAPEAPISNKHLVAGIKASLSTANQMSLVAKLLLSMDTTTVNEGLRTLFSASLMEKANEINKTS